MTLIAQAYINLRLSGNSPEALQAFGRVADEIAFHSAREVYHFAVSVEIDVRRGSLKTWATIAVTGVFGLYGFVADYKGFKEGLAEITSDARKFSGLFNRLYLERSAMTHVEVIRSERRLKDPGKLMRVLQEAERLERRRPYITNEEFNQKLRYLSWQFESAMRSFSPEDRQLLRVISSSSSAPGLLQVTIPRIGLRPPDYEELSGAVPALTYNVEQPYVPRLGYRNTFQAGETEDSPKTGEVVLRLMPPPD